MGTPLDLLHAIRWNAYGEPKTHAITCSSVTGQLVLRSVIEIRVTLGAATAEMVSRRDL